MAGGGRCAWMPASLGGYTSAVGGSSSCARTVHQTKAILANFTSRAHSIVALEPPQPRLARLRNLALCLCALQTEEMPAALCVPPSAPSHQAASLRSLRSNANLRRVWYLDSAQCTSLPTAVVLARHTILRHAPSTAGKDPSFLHGPAGRVASVILALTVTSKSRALSLCRPEESFPKASLIST
jgi:hypothetical protein